LPIELGKGKNAHVGIRSEKCRPKFMLGEPQQTVKCRERGIKGAPAGDNGA
jgi:hypothetical protein